MWLVLRYSRHIKADYEEKQNVKGYRQQLLFGFEPRKREFTQPNRRKLKGKNPFSPPDMKPNRGEITDRNLKTIASTLTYMDSGVQVVKGNQDHLTDTKLYVGRHSIHPLFTPS